MSLSGTKDQETGPVFAGSPKKVLFRHILILFHLQM